MNGKLEMLELERIDREGSLYRMSYYADLTPLRESILEKELVNPPWVQETTPGRYRVVCGFRRLACLEDLGRRRCPAFVVSPGIPEPALFETALHENASIRCFNPVEKAHILQTLKRYFGIGKKTLLEKYVPLLSRNENSGSVLRWEKILAYPGFLQEAFASGTLCFGVTALLDLLDPGDREAFLELVRLLRLGDRRQRETALLAGDLLRIEKTGLRKLLSGEEVRRILDTAASSSGNAAKRFTEWLRSRRYPQHHAVRNRFEQWKKTLKLPKTMQVEAPPFFEDDRTHLHFAFRNRAEFDRAFAALERIRNAGKIEELEKDPE